MDTAVTRLRCERTGTLPDYAPGAAPIWMYGVAYVSRDTATTAPAADAASAQSLPPPPAYAPPAAVPSTDVLPTFDDVCCVPTHSCVPATHCACVRPFLSPLPLMRAHTPSSSARPHTACCG